MATHHRSAEIAGRRIFYREAGLLDGGHFLLESQLDAVASLMRPFLAQHL